MPVMDGIEASKRINKIIKDSREELKIEEDEQINSNSRQPQMERDICSIVALTAFSTVDNQK